MLILLSLLAADPAAMMKVADEHLTILRQPAPDDGNSRYRLNPNVTAPSDGKADALAVTGADCERIGTVYCTSRPRTIYTTAY